MSPRGTHAVSWLSCADVHSKKRGSHEPLVKCATRWRLVFGLVATFVMAMLAAHLLPSLVPLFGRDIAVVVSIHVREHVAGASHAATVAVSALVMMLSRVVFPAPVMPRWGQFIHRQHAVVVLVQALEPALGTLGEPGAVFVLIDLAVAIGIDSVKVPLAHDLRHFGQFRRRELAVTIGIKLFEQ